MNDTNNASIRNNNGFDRVMALLGLSLLLLCIPFGWSFPLLPQNPFQAAQTDKHCDGLAFGSSCHRRRRRRRGSAPSSLGVLSDRTSSDTRVEEGDSSNDNSIIDDNNEDIKNTGMREGEEEESVNHLPPRFLPGRQAWKNHHQATLQLIRNHRGGGGGGSAGIEGENPTVNSIDVKNNNNNNNNNNPVSALFSNLMPNNEKENDSTTQTITKTTTTTTKKQTKMMTTEATTNTPGSTVETTDTDTTVATATRPPTPTAPVVTADTAAERLRGGPSSSGESTSSSGGSNPLLVSSTEEWKRLQEHAKHIKTTHLKDLLMDKDRCDSLCAEHDGVYLDYSRQRVTSETLRLLIDLAERQNLRGKINDMLNGEKINFTEDRAVLHTALRARRDQQGTVFVDGIDAIKEVYEVLDQIKVFTEGVRSGKLRGYTGKRLRNIVSVGIGGSYLGPEFLHEVLKTEPEGVNAALGYSLRFLANVDPVDVERTCTDLDPEETLIVIVSKTFTTAETMLNARTMRQWLWDFMGNDKEVVQKHVVACASVSATDKVQQFGIDTENYFFRFWDWVGGRYSLCSAAGAVPLSLVYGFGLFEKFLEGARSMDEHFATAPFHKNIPVLMGLIGVWNMSFLRYNTRTTLPYAEALLKLPAHIQQLDMESNGKYMTRHNIPVDYPVGEIDFGEPGTNGQHSFYQLLHMGQTVPCEFIGFVKSQHDLCLDDESLSSHDELMANFFAQPDALANGKTAEEVEAEGNPAHLIPHKVFEGNRPSLSLLLPKLTAHATGQLLSMYEHRTATQGFIWDLNSFDQWGVELGKKLAIEVRSHLLQARNNNNNDDNKIEASNPATSRILNYYINSSQKNAVDNDDTTTNKNDPPTNNRVTTITRNTFHEHYPPQGHDLGGSSGKLS